MSDFYRQMNHFATPGPIKNLGFKLFNHHGHLREEYKEHIVKKGSGIWGSELDTGLLLLLNDHFKKPVYAFVNSWESTAKGSTPCTFHDDQEQRFRDLGFRRVGNTKFFALSSDVSHSCYRLPAADDFDPAPLQPSKGTEDFMNIVVDVLASPDHLFREKLDTKYSEMSSEEVYGVVLHSSGGNLLHIVALSGMYQSAACMVARWPELRDARNDAGETPLEALEWLIEEDKMRLEYFDASERFRHGWLTPKNTEETLAVLRG
ncbi:hypothetical protein J4E86_006474 [Alternaria arbusti]|nr:uncharacterized protein J4E86_006474 [Alternaria arbusti]KAI4952937.1 hypothetical protein J4E86_006474 [Alternaria arbusti]